MSKKTKHWSALLPEAGRPILKRSNELSQLNDKKEGLERQLWETQKEINLLEIELDKMAEADWHEEEVSLAKKKGATFSYPCDLTIMRNKQKAYNATK